MNMIKRRLRYASGWTHLLWHRSHVGAALAWGGMADTPEAGTGTQPFPSTPIAHRYAGCPVGRHGGAHGQGDRGYWPAPADHCRDIRSQRKCPIRVLYDLPTQTAAADEIAPQRL